VMDVARDAIVTLILVAAPLMLVGLVSASSSRCSRRSPRSRSRRWCSCEDPRDLPRHADRAAVMADALHSNFLRIAAHITNG